MITSTHNPKIQSARALLSNPRERQAAGLFILEGVRLVEEALANGWAPEQVFFTSRLSERGRALVEDSAKQGAAVEEISPELMKSLADTETPQGILAVMLQQKQVFPTNLDFVVIADNLRDPGNLGTLLRTSAAAGVQGVLLAPGTADAYSPKVLRSGMGAHFRLPVRHCEWDEIREICKQTTKPALRVLLTDVGGGKPLWSVDLRAPLAIVIGSEAEGASEGGRALADTAVTIPMPGRSESLNAAVAAGILIFEVVRQRNMGST